ncbi:MAG: hypothetical protein RL095_4008 [Verrucomicrobiota bacterium]
MNNNLRYRPEIDGLRALAVLGVLLYHLNPSWLPGGYLGVDIFFVISGFLITSILVKGWQSGDFTYRQFYLRRARRILPAMLVVTALTAFASYFILFPDEMKSAARACRQALLCCSNYYFAKGDGYFDPGAELNPFLHTWSLGVEEQFYFVFPVLGIFAFRRGWLKARWIGLFVLIGLIGASLLTHFRPTYAFFSLESRAWELACGSWLAVASSRGSTLAWLQSRGAAASGLLLMLSSLIFLGRNPSTPAPAAIIPVLGAALFIAGRSGGEGSPLFRLFTAAPVLYLGRISYVLYLVHWPLIVLCKAHFGALDTTELALLAVVSIILAAILHHLLEDPLRRGRLLSSSAAFLGSLALASLILFAASQTAVSRKGLVNQRIVSSYDEILPELGKKSFWSSETKPLKLGDSRQKASLAIWGDSHAQMLLKGLHPSLKEQGLALEAWISGGCLPVPGLKSKDDSEILNQRALEAISRPDIRQVIIAARWTLYLKGGFDLKQPRPPRPSLSGITDSVEAAAALELRLGQLIDRLQYQGKKVYLVYPVPESGAPVAADLVRRDLRAESITDLSSPEAAANYPRRQDLTLALLDRLCATRPALIPLRAESVLLSTSGLKLSQGRVALYVDDNHLSCRGAEILIRSWHRELQKLNTSHPN